MGAQDLWKKFKKYYLELTELEFALDISRVHFTDKQIASFEKRFQAAFSAMQELEKGAIANPDENRMVGHYWLRSPKLAPSSDLRRTIQSTNTKIKSFTQKVLSKKIKGQKGAFENVLLIGIGGSALGPQFLDHALRPAAKGLKAYFFDNTDPDGIDRTLKDLKGQLGKTLTIVISKSGGTKETRNGMLEAQAAYKRAKLNYGKHFVAITGEGSPLFQYAKDQEWLEIFPMWDWVGGRTSVMSAVGLLPMALSGYDIQAFLKGAEQMDVATRQKKLLKNPAALLAVMWYIIGKGRGEKDMVILPYKDRLELFSRYLQQLVMESLGKKLDLKGKKVNQGLAVYGNKGSTDQHAYVQQLRDGLNNFFAVFLEVKKSREGKSILVDPKTSSGDYLEGFYLGTRRALFESGRQSISITLEEVNEKAVGRLIALFERAVGYYALLVGINAYHQPGVEAGKKAAGEVLDLKLKLLDFAKAHRKPFTADQAARGMKQPDDVEHIFKLLEFMSSNSDSGIQSTRKGQGPTKQFKVK